MKKLFTAMAALALCSTAAFAQDEISLMEFTPKDGSTINPTAQITATLTDAAYAYNPAGVMVMPVSGSGFSREPHDPFTAAIVNGTISFPLDKEMWGDPYNGKYYLGLMVVLTDEYGAPIEDEETEEYAMGTVGYVCNDLNPAAWVKNYPTERNFTEEGLTFERFYNVGECTFYFTKEVTLPTGSIGSIVYTTDSTTARSRITDYNAEWDADMGLYAVTVDVHNDAFEADELEIINVTLSGIKNANDEVINVPAIIVENTDVTPQKAPKKGIANGLISNVETVNIYTVQGMLIKENVSANTVNELPAGMYIVNGKKVVVR